MKKKWKNLIVLCLAATLVCFLPVRVAEAVEDNGNLMLEAAPEENCNLPLEASVVDADNPSSEGNGETVPPDDENDEGNNNPPSGGSGAENNNPPAGEPLKFVDIREDITYLKDVSFQVKGSPTKVTIKKDGQGGEEEELTAESGNTYKVTVDGKKGTYIITAVKEENGEEKEKISCKVKINGKKDGDKIVLSSGTYVLETGQEYKFEAGNGTYWKVDGEENHTVYYGGRSFYVSADKDYCITKSGWGFW